jgi:hypothetical protein
MNIFVIDKDTKTNIGILDFIPKMNERIILNSIEWKEWEHVVDCVLHYPKEHGVLVFVEKISITDIHYSQIIKDIKWN